MVEVRVARLGLDSSSKTYVVILQEKAGERLLPIWIGQPEAESIVMQMNGIRRDRPLTHDLCKSLIVGLGGALRRDPGQPVLLLLDVARDVVRGVLRHEQRGPVGRFGREEQRLAEGSAPGPFVRPVAPRVEGGVVDEA